MTGANTRQGEVQDRLARIREQIAAACARSGRNPSEVQLIGVSKRQPPERIVAALRSGVTQLGENYAQELRAKQPLVEELLRDAPGSPPTYQWRMIGALQRNKVKTIVPLVAAVDSVDRESLARELDRRAAAADRRLEICVQVNISEEPQKAGIAPSRVPELLAVCAELEHIDLVGLMAIPAAFTEPERNRPAFARLRALRDTLQQLPGGDSLRELSMGMSADFEVAIEEGATLVRIGSRLFGPRELEPTQAQEEP